MGCEDRGGEGLRGDAAGEGGVVVDVEFEEMEEFISYKVYGAVHVFFDAKEEFEGATGFVADGEGYVL